MKKVMTLMALATLGLTVGTATIFSNQPQAQAKTKAYSWVKTKKYSNLPYHAKSTKTSAYMWNWNHTKKLHNLKNYPRTTWYLSESIKMVSGKSSGIYYQVKSGNKKTTGYVWRGYLTKGVNPAAGTTTSNTATTPSSTNSQSTTSSTTSTTNNSQVDNTLNQDLVDLFPGAVQDTTLQNLANQRPNEIPTADSFDPRSTDDPFYTLLQSSLSTTDFSHLIRIALVSYPSTTSGTEYGSDYLKAGTITFSDYAKKSIAYTMSYDSNFSFDNYKGWRIGAYAYPKDSSQYGRGIILLLPAK